MTEMALHPPARKDKDDGAGAENRIFWIRLWLAAIAGLVLAMVMVGGATRLTDSGLSITEWKPVTGIVPPMSDQGWASEFEKYRQIPEYELINKGMTLEEFKDIYWWEWSHRFLGRMIGFVFFIPFLVFWLRGWLTRRSKWQGIGVLALGGLQGAVGWYMVASGLVDRVDVSQYRLAMHLGLAAIILASVVLMARDVRLARLADQAEALPSRFRVTSYALVGLVFLQILLGALVAGLDAGLTYNTWPLMDGSFIPHGLFFKAPWYVNPFENILTVQFDHRMMAYLVLGVAIFHAIQSRGLRDQAAIRRAHFLSVLVGTQVVVGIVTLLTVVHIHIALAHQAIAFVTFAFAVLHADANRRGTLPAD